MDLISRFKEQLRAGDRLRIVFPEGGDERVLAAARRIAAEGWARPVVVAETDPGAGVERLDPADGKLLARYAAAYRRARPDVSEKVAARVVRKALVFGGAAVAAGDADGLVAGAANATAAVISAASLTVGLAEGIGTPSSFFLMDFPDFLGQGPRTL